MKPLEVSYLSPRQQLIKELAKFANTHPLDEWGLKDVEDSFAAIVSPYEIQKSDLTSVNLEIDPDLIGKVIDIDYQPGEATHQSWKGKVINIFYRGIPVEVDDYLRVVLMVSNEEYKKLLSSSIEDNLKPQIYHRIILKDEKRGVVIIPYFKGVTITKYREL